MARLSLVAFAAMVVTTGTAQANCSNATIQGDWAFTVHGNALTPDGASVARIDGVGIITFDGFGNLRQQDFIVVNGVHPDPKGFHGNESGTYQVGADCTGPMSNPDTSHGRRGSAQLNAVPGQPDRLRQRAFHRADLWPPV